MSALAWKAELLELIAVCRDDVPSDAARARLQTLVVEHAEAARLYVRMTHLAASLRWTLGVAVPASEPAEELPSDLSADLSTALPAEPADDPVIVPAATFLPDPAAPPAPVPASAAEASPGLFGRLAWAASRPIVWSTLLATVLFTGYAGFLLWGLLGSMYHARQVALHREEVRNHPAQITASKDAVWSADPTEAVAPQEDLKDPTAPDRQPEFSVQHSDSASDPASGIQHSSFSLQHSQIPEGKPLNLASGTVALELKQGVRLTVEGPANWTVDGDNHVTLQSGRLVATVPHRAIGFTVKTPTAEIVDLGTEFDVEVGPQGRANVNVRTGRVQVAWRSSSALARQPVTLVKGEAVTVGAESGIAHIPFEPLVLDTQLSATLEDIPEGTAKTPGDLAGLCLWLRADRGVTLDADRRVERWADQSGNGFDAVQANAANRPSLGPVSQGGEQAVVAFDGTDDFLLGEKSLGIDGGGDSTIVLVMDTPKSNVFYGGIFSLCSRHGADWNSPDGQAISLSRNVGTREICIHQNMPGDRIARAGADPIILEYPVASKGCSTVIVTKTHGIASLRVDGETLGFDEFDFSAAHLATGTNDNGYCLGARSGPDQQPAGIGQFGRFAIAEIIVFDRALQGEDGRALSNYLMRRNDQIDTNRRP